MKTLTTILIVIFLLAVSIFGLIAGRSLIGSRSGSEDQPGGSIEEEPDNTQMDPGDVDTEIVTEPEEEEEIDKSSIQTVEIYLDGSKDDGIFLGEAKYGLTSKEAYNIYGEDFSESGYMFVINNDKYDFVPGSMHYLYIYTYIPEYGWEYTRERIVIEGESDQSQSIELHIDSVPHNTIIEKDNTSVRVSGWSADLSVTDNTGIDRIEVYLNGPKGFGRSLGVADYGADRPDVANAFANANYTYSGYNLYFDASGLEAGSINTLYAYSFSNNGTYHYITRDFMMEGEGKEQNVILSVEADMNNDSIEISGWAINKKWIIEGRPRRLDQEYTDKKIIFTSNMTGDENIFSMNLDGSKLAQLTDHAGMDSYPAVSPDGKKIAYTSDIKGHWQIVTMNRDGTDKVQLTGTPTRSGFPTWSYDGRYIFYEVYEDGDWEIYRINTDGTQIKRITFNTGADDWHPYTHPFKYNVIYESGVPGHEDIYIMDFDGNNIQKISDTPMRKRVPTVSIDGAIIAFVSYEGNDFFIYTMDQNGDNIIRLPGAPINSGHPDISPDNKYITFQARTSGGNDNSEIYIMDMDGKNLTRLTNTGGKNWDPVFVFNIAE